MLGDARLLLRLRVRHARTAVLRAVHALGTDLAHDRGLGERLYQVYALAVVAVAGALMWFALLDAVAEVCAAAGAAALASALPLFLMLPAALFAWLAARGLRTSVVALSRADVSFVAASGVSSGAVVGVGAAVAVAGGTVAGAVAGFLAGTGLAAAGLPFGAGEASFAGAALGAAALCGAWALGAARLALARSHGRAAVLVRLAPVLVAVVFAWTVAVWTAAGAFVAGNLPLAMAGVCGLACAAVAAALLARNAARIDRTRVAEESALSADLRAFGVLSSLDQNTVADFRRRAKLARRRPRLHLPATTGRGALVARSALSLARQYEGWPALAMLGAAVTPLGVAALLGAAGPQALLFWLMALVLYPRGQREASRAFRDDLRVRLVRDRLPFGTLELLALDSLPGFVLASIFTCATVPFMVPSGVPVAAALALGVVLNAGAVLACGLESVRVFPGGPRPWSEGGWIMLVVTATVFSFAGNPLVTLAGAAVACLVIAGIVHSGVESVL